MQRQVSEESLLLQWFNVWHHVAYSTVGGVTAGHGTVAYPKKKSRAGRPVDAPKTVGKECHNSYLKHHGALHPDGLLSSYKPKEEVIAPGPSATGWVQHKLSMDELADIFDLSSHIRLEENICDQRLALITKSVPGK
eukprot:6348569-Ditylum_brightwellii.AAC.1